MMKNKPTPRRLSRRSFLKLGTQGALLAALGGGSALYGLTRSNPSLAAPALPNLTSKQGLLPPKRPSAATVNIRLAATDGFISLPGRRVSDDDGVFVFGFIRVPMSVSPSLTENIGDAILEFKGRVQGPSPIISVNQEDQVNITMTNLGFEQRPDLDDSHTIHWHGFRNPNAIFDGVPEVSISVPPARSFTYFYLPHHPGSYPYHCHFEDTEHVQLGMDGVVFVNPIDGGGNPLKQAYDDASTAFDRQYALLLNEIDTSPHDQLVNVQEFVWSDFDPNYWVINSRSYPDTLLSDTAIQSTELVQRQPISSLIQALPGEEILLRFVSLGYQQQAMQLLGIRMRVVGQDAVPLGSLAYETSTLYIGPGETRDALFTAPAFDPGQPVASDDAGDYNVYWLKNHNYQRLTNGAGDRARDPGAPAVIADPEDLFSNPAPVGGQITQVRVYNPATAHADFSSGQDYANQTMPKVV